jgi:ATP-binding cassette subfamily F protein 3
MEGIVMSMLTISNVVKEYRNKVVLNGASLRIEKGERVALVGPNGAGKTTLLRIAAGVETCDSGSAFTAKGVRMGYLTQDLNEMDASGRVFKETALFHEEISRLEQKMRSLEAKMADPRLVEDREQYDAVLAEYSRLVNRYESLDGYTIESKIKSMLLGLGLKEKALTLPVELLSGGEKMRVALARILLDEPDLLVLDEPTNHLDIDGVEWLEGFLKRFDGGVLVVSHDRYFLDQVSTRVAELDNGTITERSGNYTTFMEQKAKMLEFVRREQFRLRQEIRRENSIAAQLKSTQKISAWKSRLKSVERLQNELDLKLKEMRNQHHLRETAGPRIHFDNARHVSAEIAMADRLSKYYGDKAVFKDVSFVIRGGEKVGIIGPNGCGKTTLLNILLEEDTDFMGRARLGSWVKYGFLGQVVEFEDEERTLLEELMTINDMKEHEAREQLSKFQFYGDDVDKKISVLSGGERSRLYLCCMMLEMPDCLIMDEPTNHLDIQSRDALETALLKFRGTIIAVSHDRYFLNRCINRILEFSDGTIHSYEGNYERYRQIRMAAEEAKSTQQKNEQKYESANKNKNSAAGEESQTVHKPDPVQIEAKICELEEKQKELEASFGPDTPHETYIVYASLAKELENLYEQLAETI